MNLKLEQLENELKTIYTPDSIIDLIKLNQLSLNILNVYYLIGGDINYQDEYGKTFLMYACGNGNLELASKLIDYGADVNYQDMYKSNALINSIVDDKNDICQLLIENGADVNIVNEYGVNIILFLAKLRNNKFIIDLINNYI